MNLSKIIQIEGGIEFIGRSMQRQIASTLNFVIANLMATDIRTKMRGIPVEDVEQPKTAPVNLDPLLLKYGNTLDRRNEADENARGDETSDLNRIEQGFDGTEDPMVLAGRLKVMRDCCALSLYKYATMRPNPLGKPGETYMNPFDIAQTLEASFEAQLKRQPKVNEVQVRAQAEAYGLDPQDVLRIELRRQEASLRFLRDNKTEMIAKLHSLTAYRHPIGMEGDADRQQHEDDEYAPNWESFDELELEIPATRRASLYVAADRGLYYERDNAIGLVVRGSPDGYGAVRMVNAKRVELQKAFEYLMMNPKIKAEIGEAVKRGARYPQMTVLTEYDLKSVKAA